MHKFGGSGMNETEKRRKQLLEETRRRYGDSRVPPAIHPRYGGVYTNLYGNENEEAGMPRSFGVRLMIAIVLFSAFIAMEDQKVKVANVSSERIVSEIEKLPVEEWRELDIW